MNRLVIILILFGTSYVFAQNSVTKHGNLKVDGIYLKDQYNINLMLRGVSYGWSNEHYRFYNESSVAWLASDWKVSVVRAAVGIEPANGYLDAPLKTTGYITQLIEGAIKNNIYVIVAWHCNNKHLSQSIDFFTELAKKYGSCQNIIYELFTEPDDETWDELKPYYTTLIQSIRAIDPDNIILLSAPYWSQQIRTVADDPLTGLTNTLFTVHFCVGASGQNLRDDCDYALQKGIPIIVSDHLLTDCSCDGKLYAEEWQKWIDWFDQNSISWVNWSISDKAEECSFLLPGANSNGNWTEKDLNESGVLVRNKLLEYAGE